MKLKTLQALAVVVVLLAVTTGANVQEAAPPL